MTRSFKVLVSALLGSAVLLSFSGMAIAAVTKDTVVPGDVETLSAKAGNASVDLTWSAATDNVAVTGYTVYYGLDEVTSANTAKYTTHVDTTGTDTKYTVKGLTNGKKYYFAVTARDAAKNESDSYSPYISAVPMSGVMADTTGGAAAAGTTVVTAKPGADTTAPTVTKAEALNKNQVRVTFSEAVKLPVKDPQKSFTVQDNITYETLLTKAVVPDPDDKDVKDGKPGKAFILDTDDQAPNSEYIITAGISIEDLAGNPINSGTSDFASFTGSTMTKEAYVKLHPAAPAAPVGGTVKDPTKGTADTAPIGGDGKLVATADATVGGVTDFSVSVKVINDTTLSVSFTQPVVFNIDPSENFEITKKSDDKVKLELSSILPDDNKKDVLITATMEPGTEYVLKAKNIVDATGKALASGKDTAAFKSSGTAVVGTGTGGVVPAGGTVADVTPPSDVTNLAAKVLKAFGVQLNWTGAKNVTGDLFGYVLYHSTDSKQYGVLTSLAKENTAYEVKDLQPGYHYFKVTSKDASGNESKGKTVKVYLAKTGPEMGLVLLASMGLGRVFGKKKNKKQK